MSEENQPKTISGWLRPLSMPSIQVLPFETPEKEIDPIALLRDLSRDRPENPLETIKNRYLRLSTSDLDIPIVPARLLRSLLYYEKRHAFYRPENEVGRTQSNDYC